jgi:LysM repeat protein
MKILNPCLISGLLLVSLLSGCQSALPQTTSLPTTTLGPLTPYWTPRPLIPTETLTPEVVIPLTPTPTSTPFTHVVAQGETMLGIALQYSITLEALQAANPGVDAQFLSVGTALIIPLAGVIQPEAPTPTPILVPWTAPLCYRTGDGGALCFLVVQNDRLIPLENLSAWIGLYTPSGDIVASQLAVGPLNILRPGQAMPLVVYFPSPLPVEFSARGELLSAGELAVGDSRYLDWPVILESMDIMGDGLRLAVLTGRIEPPANSQAPGQVWVVAVAYDQAGSVVGVRKWESAGEFSFELSVYSLRGPIERVELLVEVRP